MAARIAAVEAEATQVHEEVKRKEAQGRQHRRQLQAEAAAAAQEKRPAFLATREAPGWQRRPEARATKIVQEGAEWPLRRRAPTTGFWERANASRKPSQTAKKAAERDLLLDAGEAIEAPAQDGDRLAALGYWVSPAFVLEKTERKLQGRRIVEKVKDRFCVNMKRANTRGRKRRFKNDHLEMLPDCTPSVKENPDTHLITWDVKGAFKHVGIKPKHLHRFAVDLGPDVPGARFIIMLVLPFGWLNSPYFWGQVMAEPIRAMRGQGVPTLLYVDDGLAELYDDLQPGARFQRGMMARSDGRGPTVPPHGTSAGVVIAWDGTQGPSTTSEGNPRRQQVAKDPAWRRGEEKEDEGRTRSAMGKILRKHGGSLATEFRLYVYCEYSVNS